MSCFPGNRGPCTLTYFFGQGGSEGVWRRCKKAARCSIPHLYGPTLTPQSQSVTSGLASLQVAAYGGKLRYTLSYTAGPQGSPLSDPDVQITVSIWMPCWVGRRAGLKPGAPSAFVLCPFHPALSFLAQAGRVRSVPPHPCLVGHYPSRGSCCWEKGAVGMCLTPLGT